MVEFFVYWGGGGGYVDFSAGWQMCSFTAKSDNLWARATPDINWPSGLEKCFERDEMICGLLLLSWWAKWEILLELARTFSRSSLKIFILRSEIFDPFCYSVVYLLLISFLSPFWWTIGKNSFPIIHSFLLVELPISSIAGNWHDGKGEYMRFPKRNWTVWRVNLELFDDLFRRECDKYRPTAKRGRFGDGECSAALEEWQAHEVRLNSVGLSRRRHSLFGHR